MLPRIVAWTIKHHWIFLIFILGLQWFTGQFMYLSLARTIHNLNSKVIVILTLGLAFDKLYLWLKSKGKI